MIRRIYSDLATFKDLSFRPGLNILLAEKSKGATDKQTRNRAGKSSTIEIMHFLLGSSCDKDSLFRGKALEAVRFGMEFDLGGQFTRVERTGSQPSRLTVAGDTIHWPLLPAPSAAQKDLFQSSELSNDNWKVVLGKLMFGLEEFEGTGSPSYRSLISYFIRRDRVGGMAQPTMYFSQQGPVDQQVNLTFLLGLDWSIPQAWQAVRNRETSLKQLKKGMREGAFGHVIGTAAAIKSELIVAQDRQKRLKAAVASFQVVEHYHDLEQEASTLTTKIAKLSDDNVMDERYLQELEASTLEEIPPAPHDLERLYQESGIVLPALVKKRFEDVQAFHESVVKNRRAYLLSEKEATRVRIQQRNLDKNKLDARRAELMGILRSSGALDHFTALSQELAQMTTTAEMLRQKHDSAEALETGDLKLKVERAQLLERLRQDYSEQDAVIREAVLTFRDISSRLYEEAQAGTLTIKPTENGPLFEPHIPGEKSKGVNNMRIFCFDMMLMLLSLRRGRSPGFLVHDSHLFDGVDERQVGKALDLGAQLAKQEGFQYIVTMNSDAIPKEVPSGFQIEEYTLPIRLTDASEDGGLFGFRFE
jgi:uncharacterized protein YydD (DUF2326 family)